MDEFIQFIQASFANVILPFLQIVARAHKQTRLIVSLVCHNRRRQHINLRRRIPLHGEWKLDPGLKKMKS